MNYLVLIPLMLIIIINLILINNVANIELTTTKLISIITNMPGVVDVFVWTEVQFCYGEFWEWWSSIKLVCFVRSPGLGVIWSYNTFIPMSWQSMMPWFSNIVGVLRFLDVTEEPVDCVLLSESHEMDLTNICN